MISLLLSLPLMVASEKSGWEDKSMADKYLWMSMDACLAQGSGSDRRQGRANEGGR